MLITELLEGCRWRGGKLSELLALLGADVDERLDELRHGAGEREREPLGAPPLAAPLRRGACLAVERADGAPCPQSACTPRRPGAPASRGGGSGPRRAPRTPPAGGAAGAA